MANLQIRNVPEPIHRALKSRAAAAGMSLSDYLLDEVSRGVEYPPVEAVLQRAARRPGDYPTSQEIVAVIREHRGELPPRGGGGEDVGRG